MLHAVRNLTVMQWLFQSTHTDTHFVKQDGATAQVRPVRISRLPLNGPIIKRPFTFTGHTVLRQVWQTWASASLPGSGRGSIPRRTTLIHSSDSWRVATAAVEPLANI